MTKAKTLFACQSCGVQLSKWAGQCPDCGQWNTLVETPARPEHPQDKNRFAGVISQGICSGGDVATGIDVYTPTGIAELDRVLGGGLVAGSVVLMGGEPGIGKSTLLLQTLIRLTGQGAPSPLYVTGEESLGQILLRAKRLGLSADRLRLLAETRVEAILSLASVERPNVMVVDSIQTMYTELLNAAPGGVAQVRESAALLVRFAKNTGVVVVLVGHVTKEGALAGPRVLEHMVDTVLYFESEGSSRFRIIRAAKNRFGAVNELGIFAMSDTGLKQVSNPSAIFLSHHERALAGSVVMVTREGTRPLLVEVQALVDDTQLAAPRRLAVGVDTNRLAMLLAVLRRQGGVSTHDQDVFLNVVGGVRVNETASDLPVLISVFSSLRNRPVPQGLVLFGEVGLSGEIRPVQGGEERLREAMKHGFERAIAPKANAPRKKWAGIEIHPVGQLSEALALI
uniref:DNA repair protein RadA n=1 Tax=Candidatus Kentrum eta TaxID=2126337 RepID=A0A450UU36_9GAMM|nr:MAG: DNA replication and repair protein RadA [Candidatus Kentron sp. H]VFJ96794.1 MAG: DNA replication and repair protein RadA [Candidatus Kentron sp. H]VFK02564.1 MAG: DNA replication and repair protein RadA [Candidatus Kentron sp. H]